MPTFCFVRGKDGSYVHRFYRSYLDCPRRIRHEGKVYTKAWACTHDKERQPGQGNGKWPIYSEAAAVLPDQVEEAKEHCRRSGVPTEYDQHGRPEWRNAGHRRKHNKAWRNFDKAGYD